MRALTLITSATCLALFAGCGQESSSNRASAEGSACPPVSGNATTTASLKHARARFAPSSPSADNHNFLGAIACGDYSYLSGNWTVPEPPKSDDGQVIYLWIGLEPADGSCVIQPVLGWFSGIGWTISSWVCCVSDSTGCYNGNTVSVSPGDHITGTLSLDNSGNWTILTKDTTTGGTSSLVVSAEAAGGAQVQLDGGMMETYNIASCADYPASSPIAFTSLSTIGSGAAQSPSLYTSYWYDDGCGETVSTPALGQVALSVGAQNRQPDAKQASSASLLSFSPSQY